MWPAMHVACGSPYDSAGWLAQSGGAEPGMKGREVVLLVGVGRSLSGGRAKVLSAICRSADLE
jgi:hypothetical protein